MRRFNEAGEDARAGFCALVIRKCESMCLRNSEVKMIH